MSEIIASLLMIVIVVSLGATVLAYASNGFNSFGNGFSNLLTNSGNQIAENYVVEQVVFTNTGTGYNVRGYFVCEKYRNKSYNNLSSLRSKLNFECLCRTVHRVTAACHN